MAVAAAIILAPVGVMAATGSVVSIADPSHPSQKAHVTSRGALEVTPKGTQTVAGTVRVNNLPATQRVTGSVTAQPGLPGTPFTRTGDLEANPVTVPAGKHLVIQTISILLIASNPGSVHAEVDFTSGGKSAAVYVPLTRSFVESSPTNVQGWVGTVSVNIYADPGSKVSLNAFSLNGTVDSRDLTVSGFLA